MGKRFASSPDKGRVGEGFAAVGQKIRLLQAESSSNSLNSPLSEGKKPLESLCRREENSLDRRLGGSGQPVLIALSAKLPPQT
jgi:hypothetical protein